MAVSRHSTPANTINTGTRSRAYPSATSPGPTSCRRRRIYGHRFAVARAWYTTTRRTKPLTARSARRGQREYRGPRGVVWPGG